MAQARPYESKEKKAPGGLLRLLNTVSSCGVMGRCVRGQSKHPGLLQAEARLLGLCAKYMAPYARARVCISL